MTIYLAALVVFLLAVVGMAVGVILSNRRLRGSCGGMAGLKDEKGRPLCEACTTPSELCDGVDDGLARNDAETDPKDVAPVETENPSDRKPGRSRRTHDVAPLGLVLAGLAVFGWAAPVCAEDGKKPESAPFSLAWIPKDAVGVVAVRPAAVLARAEFKPVRNLLEKEDSSESQSGVPLSKVESQPSGVCSTRRTAAARSGDQAR